MAAIEYRLFFNNTSATREQLDRVDEIRVEQEVDMAWEARVRMAVRVDDRGKWTGEDEDFMAAFSRVRVEIRIGEGAFAALIDGPITGVDSNMNSEPGQSAVTLTVRDDSVYLDLEENVSRFENLPDHEIAAWIFGEFEQIASTDIEETPASGSSLPPMVVQRGTAMQIVRSLARRQGMHAYLLPGESPGRSVGCFKEFPTQTDGLPSLILLGERRNLSTFNAAHNARSPSTVRTSVLSITDKGVTARTSSFRDIDLLGEEPAFESETHTGARILPPHLGESLAPDRAASAEAACSAYAFEAVGTVRSPCYQGILQPYRVVSVVGVNGRLSGDYLITRVTHTLDRSNYGQSFTVRRNARSEGTGGGANDLAGSIF
ncbi:MAG: hypothetical protein GY737_17970 [Desulfobacteraceae bacterium]|nr:hypothetical protein [Desulfobacteraceae bacterium]